MTEQPPTEVGGFARAAWDWKSTRFAPRAGDALTATCAAFGKPWPRISMAEANRLEAGGFNLVMEIKKTGLSQNKIGYLPIQGRHQLFWVALVTVDDERVVGFIPLDGL